VAPPTSPQSPMIYLLDLNGVQPILDVLEPALSELARDIKAGRFGESAVVVSTQDPVLQRYVELIATAENLPLYISGSTTAFSIIQARPAANLSRTDTETLDAVMNLGGRATASDVAHKLHLRQTAAINRLNALAAKGLLHKQQQSGRKGDLYVDYRAAAIDYSHNALQASISGALSNAGKRSDS
jgi:predicted transcriptional regulator